MTVLALVTGVEEARPIVVAAYRSAVAFDTDLRILAYKYSPAVEPERARSQDDEETGVFDCVSEVLSEMKMSSGRAAFSAASILRFVRHPNPVTATVTHTRKENVELVVASAESAVPCPGKKSLQTQLVRHVPCNLSLISTSGTRSTELRRVLAVTTDSADDRALVAGAYRLATAHEARLTIATIERQHGSHGVELGERELQSVLNGAGVAKSADVETVVLQSDDLLSAITPIAGTFDLLTLGSNNLTHLARLADSISRTTISVFRKAPPIRMWQSRNRLYDFVPAIAPSDYADLVRNLRSGSRWGSDFQIMLGLAVGIASLGLLLNSAAVIIGSMLLAPLMTPMVGAGLSLVQGNARLAGTCARSVGLGAVMALVISFLIGLALPGDELTSELTARGSPNVADLLIAFMSAAAGAYALARPTLAGSIAGVAIATALVPPLCTIGISLSDGHFENAVGAAMLFITNFLAIVLAAAGMFHWMGLGASVDPVRPSPWVRRVLFVMLVATILLTIPLSEGLVNRLRKGVTQIPAAPLSESTYDAIQQHIDAHRGASLVLAVRRTSATERRADYRIVVASESPLPQSFRHDIVKIIHAQMEDDTLRVEVIAVPQHWLADEEAVSAL